MHLTLPLVPHYCGGVPHDGARYGGPGAVGSDDRVLSDGDGHRVDRVPYSMGGTNKLAKALLAAKGQVFDLTVQDQYGKGLRCKGRESYEKGWEEKGNAFYSLKENELPVVEYLMLWQAEPANRLRYQLEIAPGHSAYGPGSRSRSCCKVRG